MLCGPVGYAETIPGFDKRPGSPLWSRKYYKKRLSPGNHSPLEGQSPQGTGWRLLLCDCKVIQDLAGSRLGSADAQGGIRVVNDYLLCLAIKATAWCMDSVTSYNEYLRRVLWAWVFPPPQLLSTRSLWRSPGPPCKAPLLSQVVSGPEAKGYGWGLVSAKHR